MSKIIKLGIWGCGGHGYDGHGKIADEIEGLRLVALCDRNPEVMNNILQKHGQNLFTTTSPEKMFRFIDAVVIATPDQFHVEHLGMAIENGIHILIEKPIASSTSDMITARELIEVAHEKNLIITSCHPRRFDPPFIWLKDELPKHIKRLGPVTGFHYDFSYHKPSAAWKSSRSLLLDHHGHEIDLLSFLFGPCSFKESLHDDSFDRYLTTGNREDGIKFTFHGTRRMEERVFHEWMTVRHSNGSVVVNTHNGEVTVIKNDIPPIFTKESCTPTNYDTRSKGVMQNFVDTILGRANNYLDSTDLFINNDSGVQLLKHGNVGYSI